MGSKKFTLMSSGLDPITVAYIGGMVTRPSSAHVILINTFIKQIRNIITTLADVIYLGNINDSNDSYRNLVKNAHHGTKEGVGLVWDSFWGYSNPSGTGYVDTHYNPSTQGVNYTLNNAGIAVFLQSNYNDGVLRYIFGSSSGSNITSYRIGTGATTDSYHINSINATSNGAVIPFYAGLKMIRRTASNAVAYLNQNVANITNTTASSAIPNYNIYLFKVGNISVSQYLGGLNFFYAGASLSDANYTILNNAANDYLIGCLFLKYGESNFGVRMARSYFLNLHNFEKYEAWEVYEFIKRHQSDYVDNIIPLASSNFDTDGTAWWEANSGVTKSYNATDKCITLATAAPQQAYIRSPVAVDIGRSYRVRFRYRSSDSTLKLSVYLNSTYVGAAQTNNMTSSWQQYDANITAVTGMLYINRVTSQISQFEVDDIIIEDVAFTTGYLFNTFGPSGQNKTVCDYLMLFKSGGNLLADGWTKSGATFRWNQDGFITGSTTSPAYTRGNNLGIITISTIDGWDGLTSLIVTQTNASVNSYYGNFPMIQKLKIGGSKMAINTGTNRMKVDFRGFSFANYVSGSRSEVTSYPGYVKINISDLVGGVYTNVIYMTGSGANANSSLSGDVTSLTSEFHSTANNVLMINAPELTGSLENITFPTAITTFNFTGDGITKGFRSWRTSLTTVTLTGCAFPTSEMDAFLAFLNTFFATNTPTANLTLLMAGATMGIPTGGASNTDLLGIVAKFAAVNKTATITVRTS